MMADYARVVDEIRLFLQSSDRTLRRDSADLAAAYAEACAEANDRLKRCARFLQQGLRSEAIHLAEAEPKLLDLVATLDFPERPEWEQLAFTYEWPKPQALLMDAAEALNEAYAQERPLQDLLRQHRLLALARAPLPDRIRILRKIADLDAGNPIWLDDVRAYERVRIQELIDETAQAAHRRDLPALAQIVDELDSLDWIETPPESLVRQARHERQHCKREAARQSLKLAGDRLLAAFSALDVPRAREQREIWLAHTRDAALPPVHALRDRVQPALDWLEQQDERERDEQEYQSAVSALEQALEGNPARAELERLGRAVMRHDREMPAELRTHYRKRLSQLEERAGRTRKLVVRSVAAVALVVGILSVLWAHQQLQASKAARVATAVDGMLAAAQLDQARNVLDALAVNEPGVANMPEVVDVRRRLEALQSRESERLTGFQQALREAEAAPPNEQNPPALQRARALATLAEEKAAVARQAQARHEAYLKDVARRENAFRRRVIELEPRVEALEGLARVDVGSAAAGNLLKQVQAELDVLESEAPHVGKDTASLAEPLVRKVGSVVRFRAARAKRDQLEQNVDNSFIMASLGKDEVVDQYVAALASLLQTFPDGPRAQALRRAIDEQPLWRAAVAWEQMTDPWLGRMAITETAEARTRLDQCRQFLKDHPRFADVSLVQTYVKHLEAIARRESSGEPGLRDQLVKLFTGRLIENLWLVRTRTGKAYYVSEQPRINEALRLRYVSGFREEKAQIFINHGDVARIERAPQSRLADTAKDRLAAMTLPTWDLTLVAILKQVHDDAELDPLLKLSLLMKVLDLAEQGSYPLELALQPYHEAMRHAAFAVNVPWMDPESGQANRLRAQAAQVVKSLPSLDRVVDQAAQHRARIEGQVAERTRWIGWLVKLDDGSYRCRVSIEPPGDVELLVLVPEAGNRSAWRPIGTRTGGEVTLRDGPDDLLLEGRPVFCRARRTTAPG